MVQGFGERLKHYRKEAGLTQLQFAERLGLKRNTIAQYERDGALPSVETVLAIAKELNISVDVLLAYGPTPSDRIALDLFRRAGYSVSAVKNEWYEVRLPLPRSLSGADPFFTRKAWFIKQGFLYPAAVALLQQAAILYPTTGVKTSTADLPSVEEIIAGIQAASERAADRAADDPVDRDPRGADE